MTRHRRSALYGAGIMEDYFLLIFNTHISFQSCNRRSTIAVITVEPADKISFVYNWMQTRLRGQYNGKWPISLVCVSRPLVTVITAIDIRCSPQQHFLKQLYTGIWLLWTCLIPNFRTLQNEPLAKNLIAITASSIDNLIYFTPSVQLCMKSDLINYHTK